MHWPVAVVQQFHLLLVRQSDQDVVVSKQHRFGKTSHIVIRQSLRRQCQQVSGIEESDWIAPLYCALNLGILLLMILVFCRLLYERSALSSTLSTLMSPPTCLRHQGMPQTSSKKQNHPNKSMKLPMQLQLAKRKLSQLTKTSSQH